MSEAMDINFKHKILEELKNVLSDNNTNLEFNNKIEGTNYFYENDCVSLYDMKTVLNEKKKEFDKLTDDFKAALETKISKNYNVQSIRCVVDKFDYENQELKIVFATSKSCYDERSFVFSKTDSDLYIKSYETGIFKPVDILALLGKDILSFFDQKNAHHDYLYDCEFCKNSVNSLFCFDVSSEEISIYFEEDAENIFDKKFELKYNVDSGKYEIYVNSYEIIEHLMYYTQQKIFENIFVKIDDCPKWMHEDLTKTKEERLNPKKNFFSTNGSNKIKQLFKRKK